MKGLNRVNLIGNLTSDIRVNATQRGTSVANASIAINSEYRDKQGEKHETVEFVDLVWWGKGAEIVAEYAGKGDPIYVEGELKTSEYQTREGEKRRKTEVNVKDFRFMGGSRRGNTPEVSVHHKQKANGYQPQDDIPF
jgi:single-strand DNA-binding protein